MYGRSWVRFASGTHIFSLSHACDKLSIPYFSFLSELKIYHLSFFIITRGAFDIADPSSMQEACHDEPIVNMTSLATSLPVAQWLERPAGVREVMGSIRVTDSFFFFVPRSLQTEYSIFLINNVVYVMPK